MSDYFFQKLDILYKKGNLRDVHQFLIQEAEKCYDEATGIRTLNYHVIMNELGSFLRNTSRYEESKQAFSEALAHLVDFGAKDTVEYAVVLVNLANTYRLSGELDLALNTLNQAEEIYRDQLDDKTDYRYVGFLNAKAVLLSTMDKNEEAIEYFQRTLDVFLETNTSPTETALTYANLATLYNKCNNEEEFKRNMNEAIKIYEKKFGGDHFHYGAALNTYGGYYYKKGEYDKAVENFKKAAELSKKYYGESRDYALSLQNLGYAYKDMGDKEKALEAFNLALPVIEKVYGKESKNYERIAKECE